MPPISLIQVGEPGRFSPEAGAVRNGPGSPGGEGNVDNHKTLLPDKLLRTSTCKTETVMNASPGVSLSVVSWNFLHC